jgi:hypothetical protein
MAQLIFFVLTILLLSTSSLPANCQRCGGSLTFRIYDEKEKIVYPSLKDSICLYSNLGTLLYKNFKPINTDYNDMMVVFWVVDSSRNNLGPFFCKPTGCGLGLWHITVKKRNKVMSIDFKNMPMEMACLVDSIPFKHGRYSIDCAGSKDTISHPNPRALHYGRQSDVIIPAALNLKKE